MCEKGWPFRTPNSYGELFTITYCAPLFPLRLIPEGPINLPRDSKRGWGIWETWGCQQDYTRTDSGRALIPQEETEMQTYILQQTSYPKLCRR